MEKIIIEKLNEIEQKENVTILYAAESGSRAWGFPSQDSDYDVRFIYVRPWKEYFTLEKKRDVIEYILNEELDMNGWDLKKALQLLYCSNMTIYEWGSSPIVYKTTDYFEELKKSLPNFFNSKAGGYHYISLAVNSFRALQEDKVKLKKYFYAVRPILACRYILKNQLPPPMNFCSLMSMELITETEIYYILKELVKRKGEMKEVVTIDRIEKLNQFIEQNIEELKRKLNKLNIPKEKNWSTLNELFLKGCLREEMAGR